MTAAAPPQDLDAEASVLGAMMVTDVLAAVIAETHLEAGHFYRERHRIVFRAILALSEAGKPIEALTVRDELRVHGKLEEAGGSDAVSEYASTVPVPGNALHYARIVVEKAQWRHRLTTSHRLQVAAREQDAEAFAAAEGQIGQDFISAGSYVDEEAQQDTLAELAQGGARADFVTPFARLNNALDGGLRRGELVVLSAYTREGKSHLGDMTLDVNQKRGDGPYCCYSNEGSLRKRVARRAARQHGVPFGALMRGDLDQDGHKRLNEHLNYGTMWPYVGCHGWTPREVCYDIRRRRWGLVLVDHLHRFRFKDERELSNAVSLFSETAAIAECCIVLICHVNRGGIGPDGQRRRPVCSDLRWSGDIENIADIVWFLWRYQDPKTAEQLERGFTYLDKARDADAGHASQPVMFNSRRLRFDLRELDPDERTPAPPRAMEAVA